MLRHLATGGMAQIYLAEFEERGATQQAVVKVILPERARDRKFVQMFLDEARVSSSFIHPHIAQLYEVGRDDDTYFYAMEYVDGENVRALIERSLRRRVRMPLSVTLAIGTRVAAALHYAHQRPSASGQQFNAVHRDVTPSNVMLGHDGGVKLLDFGIARADTRAQLTLSGTVKGKFAYMSPEQCLGKDVDRRTDVFALGIVLYELSTQRRAFRADSDFATMERILRGDLVPPSHIHADYPRELEAILLKALAIEPEARYQTAAELGAALADLQHARGLAADERPVIEIMRGLFGPEPAAEREIDTVSVPPPVLPLPSGRPSAVLAATLDPAESPAAPAWSRPAAAPVAAPAPGMVAVPAPVPRPRPVAARSRTAPPPVVAEPSSPAFAPVPSVSMPAIVHAPPLPAEPVELLAAAPALSPSPAPGSLDAPVPAVGTPPARPRVTTAEVAAAGFAVTGPLPALAEGSEPAGRASAPLATAAPVVDAGHRRGLWLATAAIVAVTVTVAAILFLS